MLSDSFFRVASCTPSVKPADIDYNIHAIYKLMEKTEAMKVDLAVFPELCITGYTCADLFNSTPIIEKAKEAVDLLCSMTAGFKTAFIIGLPHSSDGTLYNVAMLIHGGKVCTVNGKRYIPNYGEFYERRWFEPWNRQAQLYEIKGVKVGLEICEDLWVPTSIANELCIHGAEIIANLSASDDNIGKYEYLLTIIKAQSGKNICGYVYASAGFGESSTDLVFDAKNIIAENGKLLECGPRWQTEPTLVVKDIDIDALRHDRLKSGYFGARDSEISVVISDVPCHKRDSNDLLRNISAHPFVPYDDTQRSARCREIINIQTAALTKRLEATSCRSLVVGISGGLDSTLALLVACNAFDMLGHTRSGIHAVTMPGFGTTGRTRNNAEQLCRDLGVDFLTIPIADAVNQHFKDIGHDAAIHDVTYENSQARMRTLILMDLANKLKGMVLGTGDMSELALGWATYNGDHMSMYNVNGGVPKTLVKYLVQWFADEKHDGTRVSQVLKDIIDTPISPELLPPNADDTIAQCTEDFVGPYELHDFFLYYTLRYGFGPTKIFILAHKAFNGKFGDDVILSWMKVFFGRFFGQQFKRSCMPDGPKVGSVCQSPRGDWRMPSDASAALWLKEIEELSGSL